MGKDLEGCSHIGNFEDAMQANAISSPHSWLFYRENGSRCTLL